MTKLTSYQKGLIGFEITLLVLLYLAAGTLLVFGSYSLNKALNNQNAIPSLIDTLVSSSMITSECLTCNADTGNVEINGRMINDISPTEYPQFQSGDLSMPGMAFGFDGSESSNPVHTSDSTMLTDDFYISANGTLIFGHCSSYNRDCLTNPVSSVKENHAMLGVGSFFTSITSKASRCQPNILHAPTVYSVIEGTPSNTTIVPNLYYLCTCLSVGASAPFGEYCIPMNSTGLDWTGGGLV